MSNAVARKTRHRKIRSRISGTAVRPRLAIFRSNTGIYAQVIDDVAGKTLASASDMKIEKGSKSEKAVEVGKNIAAACKKAGVSVVVFDRGGFSYVGRVKALADSARAEGLQI
jgi:large subunit ribosomal protein L18